MREVWLLEYLLDRVCKAVVDLIDAIKKGEDKERMIEYLRILQGELMTIRQICAWARTRIEEKNLDELLKEEGE